MLLWTHRHSGKHPRCLLKKTTRVIGEEPSRLTNEREREKKVRVQQLPQDGSVNSRRLAQRWQMLPNQSLPSALTGTEDRTVLYWTEVESGSARAVERIDWPVDSSPRPQPKTFCWLLFVSVSSSLPADCSLASTLVWRRGCGEGWRDCVEPVGGTLRQSSSIYQPIWKRTEKRRAGRIKMSNSP